MNPPRLCCPFFHLLGHLKPRTPPPCWQVPLCGVLPVLTMSFSSFLCRTLDGPHPLALPIPFPPFLAMTRCFRALVLCPPLLVAGDLLNPWKFNSNIAPLTCFPFFPPASFKVVPEVPQPSSSKLLFDSWTCFSARDNVRVSSLHIHFSSLGPVMGKKAGASVGPECRS